MLNVVQHKAWVGERAGITTERIRAWLRKVASLCAITLFLGLVMALSPLAVHPVAAASGSAAVIDGQSAEFLAGRTALPRGKVIVISISRQWMFVYQNRRQIFASPITTGRRELATPTGVYHVYRKLHPTYFYSPWPHGSPYWYAPTFINYALEWRPGFFLHDSWWRTVYGPGTNIWHTDPRYGRQTGTHGCVTMPLRAAAWLYHWASIGTVVLIRR